jgi:preprotein translocase SecE subunit
VARDRQRAKRRKEKRQPSPPAREPGNGGVPDPRAIHRENVPGPVEHTGDVDQFEAELVAGADGEPELDDEAVERAALEAEAEAALGREPGADVDDTLVRGEDVEEAGAVSASAASPATRASAAPTQDASGRGAGRFLNFLRASWAELQRVQWPDRRQVGQATAVVLGFVVVAGAFLGVADFLAERLVDLVI